MNKQQQPAQQWKILVVDDESSFTRLLKINLETTERYLVHVENDPKLAVSAALDFRPDLVLMDVMMPDLDGGDLAFLFSKHPRLCKIPVVFLTATVRQTEVDDHAGQFGGMRFLAKPVNQTELVHCLEEHFSARHSVG
jgi:CheY-like chemotaxis protein